MKPRLKLQSRRLFARVNVHRLTVSFSPPPPPQHHGERGFKVRDIGVYGLSFFVPEDDASDFRPGVILNEIAFELSGRKIVLNAQVRYVRKIKVNSRTRRHVGVEFIDTAPDVVFFLSEYVAKKSVSKPGRVRVPMKNAKKSGSPDRNMRRRIK